MSQQHEQDAFTEQARQALDQQLQALDEPTKARLQAARREAVNTVRQGKTPSRSTSDALLRWLQQQQRWIYRVELGTAALALVAIVSLNLWSGYGNEPTGGLSASIEDLQILTQWEDVEMIENLEFYQWLAHEQQTS